MDKAKFKIADVSKNNTEVEFSLVKNKKDAAITVKANGVELLWFDPHNGMVNFSYVDEDNQALLPGLNFDKDTCRVLVYAD